MKNMMMDYYLMVITVGNGTQGATITFVYKVSGTMGHNVDVEITGSTSGAPGGDVDIEDCTLTIINNLEGVSVIDGVTTGNTNCSSIRWS